MKKSGGGSIINCCSMAGLIGSAVDPVYGASKGAVLIFTKCVALYCCEAGYNIRVNNICPGFTWTPTVESEAKMMGKGDVEAGRKFMAGLNPMGRVAMPGEIAQGILYLASDESSFVTGTELVMDGGFTAG
jgi:NAD(P)-dependent dehydrogenase (short-subunit alcohol dehydrogenase family)